MTFRKPTAHTKQYESANPSAPQQRVATGAGVIRALDSLMSDEGEPVATPRALRSRRDTDKL